MGEFGSNIRYAKSVGADVRKPQRDMRHTSRRKEMKRITGFICGPRIYEFEGWCFEWHACSGPWPMKKDGELRKRAGRTFYNMVERFCKLSKADREKYRVGGGCVPI